MRRAALVYDGDCGFCRAAVRGARALNRDDELEVVPAQSEQARRLTPALSDEERMASFHLVENGGVASGPEALAPTLRKLRGLGPAATLLERSDLLYRAAAATYRWVTPRRHRLAKLLPRRWTRPL